MIIIGLFIKPSNIGRIALYSILCINCRGAYSLVWEALDSMLLSLVTFRSAIGVVVALLSHDQMIAYGMRGKGFRMLHLYGDHLW